MDLLIHPRITKRHPEISIEDVVFAWKNYEVGAVRVPGEREVRIGHDLKGRELEMVGVLTIDGWLIYHAMTPPTKKMKQEIDKARRREKR